MKSVFFLLPLSLFCVNTRYAYVSVGSHPFNYEDNKASFREGKSAIPTLQYGFRYRATFFGIDISAGTYFQYGSLYTNFFLLPGYRAPYVGIGGSVKTLGDKKPQPKAQLGYEWGNQHWNQFFALEMTDIKFEDKRANFGLRFGFRI